MSLRTKLLALFALLAVAPLCALGIANHIQAMRALESLLVRQTHTLAERAANEIRDRYAVQRSDLLLLAENEETQRLLGARAGGDTAAERAARAVAGPFFAQLWGQFSPFYHAIEIRDARGVVVHRMGEDPGEAEGIGGGASEQPRLRFVQRVTDAASGRRLGDVLAWPTVAQLLPGSVLESRFGESGYSMVVERSSGRILYHSRQAHLRRTLESALGGRHELRADGAGAGWLSFREGDSTRIASFVTLDAPEWTVIATTAMQEFAGPFDRMRTRTLLLLLLVTLTVSAAFVLAIRRATRTLSALTRAADAVGRGDFAPELPPADGTDEVGRLTRAFRLMAAKVGEMLAQVERSRQMAAIGEFAAEIAHEIRNPLTSVKLNLQRIERVVRAGNVPGAASRPLAISLREISRLERVIRGVLHLGRPRALARRPCALHGCIQAALETVRSQAQRQRIRIETELAAGSDVVPGDAGQVEAALLNLLLNAIEAMPDGGVLRVATWTENRVDETGTIVIRVADSGPGIPAAGRDRLFRPFYTTKPEGTGLGLATALRTIEEHGGTLALEEREAPRAGSGAVFRIELPLVREAVFA